MMHRHKRPLVQVHHEVSIAEPAAKKVKRQSKRVTFSTAPHSIHTVPRVAASDIPAVWYSGHEFYHNRRCDAHWVKFYTQCDDSYNQQLFQVVGAACGKLATKPEPLLALASSPCRGLEREMTPCFRQRKKQVVSNILQSQAALRKYNNSAKAKQIDSNKSAEILASHYSKLALPALRFARLLAQGDAAFVAQQQR